MKTRLIIPFFLLMAMCLPRLSSAQDVGHPPDHNDGDKKEKIEAMKVAFISQQIDLTSAEAEKFWPIYNEFNSKREVFSKEKRDLEKDAKKTGLDKISDKQAEDMLNAELKFEQNMLDLKKEYVDKYKAVIGIKKTARFFHAEREFNNFLLQQLKEANRPPKQPPHR